MEFNSYPLRDIPWFYYYKENGDNIPIITGTCSDFRTVVWINDKEKEQMRKDFPEAVGNLYAFILGTEFKVDL